MMKDNLSFKEQVKSRLKALGMTQKELAAKMNLTETYLYYLLIGVSDTRLARERRKQIVEILDELESRCPVEK